MNIFAKAVAVGKAIVHSAHSILVKLFGEDAVEKFQDDIHTIFTEDVLVVFQDAIVLADSLKVGDEAADGPTKREAAFAKIAKDLKDKGISLADHVINLGIELVVGLLHSKTPAEQTPSPTPSPTTAETAA